MWNLSTTPLIPHHPLGEDLPPAPHIKSNGPNNRVITNLDTLRAGQITPNPVLRRMMERVEGARR
jgi:hypothetical protein